MSNYDKHLKHYGVKGMKWGHRKSYETEIKKITPKSTPQNIFGHKQSVEERNAAILKADPHAHVLDRSKLKIQPSREEVDARNKKIRNIAIGVGVPPILPLISSPLSMPVVQNWLLQVMVEATR